MTFTTIHEAVQATDDQGRPLCPEHTLGWQALHRAVDDGFELSGSEKLTVLWSYAVTELGELVFDECAPEVVARIEARYGRLVFGGWASRDMPHIGVRAGEPVGVPDGGR